MAYLKNIVLGVTTSPTSANKITYYIGNPGKYFVEELMNDPVNPYYAYLFTTDKNINSGTFGVFKMDFTPTSLKYVYTVLLMSTGSSFSVNSIFRIS